MKNLLNSALRCNRNPFAIHQPLYAIIKNTSVFLGLLILISFLFGCKKEKEGNVVDKYTGLSSQTVSELQQARTATARYQNIQNAIDDGYADIAVDVEGMGHHFMKTSIVDDKFDISAPEILVYNKNHDGTQELVAVEYAVPLTFPMPEGFTGSTDVWNGTSGFPFWLLHAWVWSYNPDGVFNWTNSTVHLH